MPGIKFLDLQGKKKVALIGSAPSSVTKAPYKDDEWLVFGCSPGAYPIAGPHAGAWAELHRWEPQVPGHQGTGQPWFSPEYVEFLTRFQGQVFMLDPVPPEIPGAVTIDVDALVEEFGPFFFTSSVSWMLALALMNPELEEIGLWGIDMAATEEYSFQRPGCQFFLTEALKRRINVTVPKESDLLQPPVFYGVTENTAMHIKLTERKRELESRLAQAEHNLNAARAQRDFFRGALDDLDYMCKTWLTHQTWLEPKLQSTGNEVRAEPLQGPAIDEFETPLVQPLNKGNGELRE